MSAAEAAQLLVAAATLVSSLAGLVIAVRTGSKTSATHDLVNGQSEALRAMSRAEGRATGVQEGIAIERDRPPS